MRIKLNQELKKLLGKKYFWIFLILLIVLFIFLDLGMAVIFTIQTLIFTHWSYTLVIFGVSSAILGAITARKMIFENKTVKDISKLLFFIALVLAIRDYGLWSGIAFILAILFLGRIIGWVTPKRKYLKRVA